MVNIKDNARSKYEEFLKEIDEVLTSDIREWIFTAKVEGDDYLFLAAFALTNVNYFNESQLIDVLLHCNPNMNKDKMSKFYEEYMELQEPDLEFRDKVCVFDIGKRRVVNMYGHDVEKVEFWYPPCKYPQLNYDEDLLENGGGYVIYGYKQ